ncbi:hypothetical protein PILCRDRAFT_329040 [Piloderma croceum F 1598]|uniref:Uncharacterized protein n=1 Tax=Piloderma croceum (strain F 1598) TaxID=765440 RepID=A0A0C3BHW9_PILCF|nr:hypothetical protein PILCRDRAFT_329040 [Piloderma croceum F 1598]
MRLRISGTSSPILNHLAIRHRVTSSLPLASTASTNRFHSPSRRCIYIYNLCVQFTFTSRECHQLVLTSLHPSWFIVVLLPHDICRCSRLDACRFLRIYAHIHILL